MYNEVFAPCPRCNSQVTLQISQIVLGFGGFHLDDPYSLRQELNEEEIEELYKRVREETFRCECGWRFNPLQNEADTEPLSVFLREHFPHHWRYKKGSSTELAMFLLIGHPEYQ